MFKVESMVFVLILTSLSCFASISGQVTETQNSAIAEANVGSTNITVKSFKQWKTERIFESLDKVNKLKAQIEQKKRSIQSTQTLPAGAQTGTSATNKTTEAGFGQLEAALSQEVEALEMNKQMTISDYFFMYLASLPKSKDVFAKAVNQLSADEMAEIILLYAQHVSSNPIDSSNTDLNLKDAKSQK